MATVGEEQIGRVLGGRYRLVAAVGTGASATVFQADDVQLRRRVAVKVLHPTLAEDQAFLRRFQAEAQAAAALNHPNIMAVFDWGMDGGIPYLVFEYLGGGSLRGILDRGRRLSASQALLIGLDACKGLDYAHRRGIVHRDIKPANLLFGEDRRLRIADFGLARAIAEAAWTEPAGVLLGTARYASPEQAKGEPVDGRSDVYSLALTLVEAVTGEVPFAGETTVTTLMNRIDKLLPVSADMGPLASVLEKAGRPDPSERSDAAELGRALVDTAQRLPRPEPLPLVATSSELFDVDPTAAVPVPPRDPTGPTAVAAEVLPVPADGYESYDDDYDLTRGRRPLRAFLVTLAVLVAAAVGAVAFLVWQRASKPSYPVESLVGLEVGEAQNRIAPNGWRVETRRERNDEQPVDHVFRQEPATGELKEGETFVMYVSDGPTLSEVPPLVGLSQADAQAQLSALQLGLAVAGEQFDETAPPGTILSFSMGGQTVEPGAEVEKGTTIDVVLSKGPAPRAVPGIIGLTPEQAEAALTGLQLVPARDVDVFSTTVPAGIVANQSLPPGQEVPRDTTIVYVVSKGPEPTTVPNLVGLTYEMAIAALQGSRLSLGETSGNEAKVVLQQDPAPGTSVPVDSKVNLLFEA